MTPPRDLCNTSWRQAVQAATHRALEARERLLADYPEWPIWRRQIKNLKNEVVRNWPEYVARLRSQVEGWGGVVYLAQDASEARHYILKVAQKHGARRIIQSKSMTAHEIGLESFLRSQGLKLTETDLGEFIVQLAGHPPAHLTAPALHLNRHQISRILSHHLGQDAPEEPGPLTRYAAKALVPRYEEAEMGITGVNFAAAREGVLVCLENEGNLRLTASRPPVHLALMGWDKLVPSLEALVPGLRLLPASATGQRLTSLVHFFRGRKSLPHGDQAFYLVILDHGRSRLAAHPEVREALYCLRCGACLNICPVFQMGAAYLYGRVYPGAIGILLAPFLPPPGDLTDMCTQCGSCKEVCPADIDLPGKIRYLRQKARSFRIYHTLAASAGVLLGEPRMFRFFEASARRLLPQGSRKTLGWLSGFGPASESFWTRWEKGGSKRSKRSKNRVILAEKGLFIGGDAETPGFPGKVQGHEVSRAAEGHFVKGGAAARFAEAGSTVVHLAGPQELARYLAATARGEIWLAEQPPLTRVALELSRLGVPFCQVGEHWAPEADTAVTPGLGAIPETGSVMVAPGSGPAVWLPYKARRHVVLVPLGQSALSLKEALTLTAESRSHWISWLTGPTRTADIEKLLVLGAQGPEELTIIFYSGDHGES